MSGRVITASGRERTMNGDRRTAFCRPAATEASPCNPPPGLRPRRVAETGRGLRITARKGEPVPAPGVDRSRDSYASIGIPPDRR